MRFPLSLQLSLTSYLLRKKFSSCEKFPMVLMLEPTHACNLECKGCGRIQEYKESLAENLSLEECLKAVDDSGAPVVSITGGEPLIYPKIGELVEAVVKKKRHIYFCTNGLLLEKSLPKFRPTPQLNFNISLDGMEKTHDAISGKSGVFQTAIEAMKVAKSKGFRVCTNTSIFKETEMDEIEELFALLHSMDIDGILVAPAFDYEDVEREIFLERQSIYGKFRRIYELSSKFKIISTPLYLKFCMGERDLKCTPWGNPTRNPQGWKSPCYLITDTHYPSFEEMMDRTDWAKYGVGNDPRCANCMMHCGFEPTVVQEVGKRFSDLKEMVVWNMS